MSDQATPTRSPALTRLRNYFLTGFIVVAPLAITVYLIWTFIGWVDGWVIPYVPKVYNPNTYLPFGVPGVGLLVAIILITLIGFLTAGFVGRTVVGYGERLLSRMPLVRNLYSGLKQIFQTVLSSQSSSFQEVGLLEYPRKGIWALVFIATETKGEVNTRLVDKGKETVSVFLPTTPNPTSGFLLFVPKEDVTILDMGVEDAAKLVISAGLVAPDHQEQLAALKKDADAKAATAGAETAKAKPAGRPRKSRKTEAAE